ncbi:hypothetical protein, partial [Dyadobacter sp. OTU695]|uniref:hypothetical protein n=1 Tax=Dyadobacter sp. OTU695 TaxID=3043860 RepID=UPI00313D22EA
LAAGRGAARLSEKINSFQRRWANRLNAAAAHMPAAKLKALLILIGVLACVAAAGLLYGGLSPQKLTIHRFELSLPRLLEPISVPESPAKQQALDQYLDSLEKAFILDSLQNSKPQISHDTSCPH